MFKLPEELIINNISELHQQLLAVLDNDSSVEIDITQVTQADTASVQLLCALQKHLRSTHNRIQWYGKSVALTTAAKTLGVLAFLELE